MIPMTPSFFDALFCFRGRLIAHSAHVFSGFRFRIMILLMFTTICAFISGCDNTDGHSVAYLEFWVSPDGDDTSSGTRFEPFLTIERAHDAVRALDKTQREKDIIITIRGGNYRLERPILLDWRDSGHDGHPVVYRAAPGEHPVISGSIRVQNWSLCDPVRGIYQAYVGKSKSRQLFVNGRRAIRARTTSYPAGFRPAYFYLFGAPLPMGIEFIPTVLNSEKWRNPSLWTNPQDIEAVIVTQWRMMIVPVQSVTPYPEYTPDPILAPDLKTGLINMKEPAWTNANIYLFDLIYQPGFWSFWQVTWFENAYEFLDEPGEWYLNRSTGLLYYIPRPGENLASADVELPVLEVLLEGRGTMEQPISHIRFEGLTFSYATWLGPNSSNGYVSDQSGFHLTGAGHQPNVIGHDPDVVRTTGNVQFRFAHHITFRSNVFAHLGGAGLDFDTGSQGNTITDNLFQDISAAAVQLGGVSTIDHHPVHPHQVTSDNVISNNFIREIGQEFVDAAGIYIGFTRRTLISHNTISDVPWAGIAMGWGWGLLDPEMFPGLPNAHRGEWGTFSTPTTNSGNRILNNLIQGFLKVVWDGGAIYTTGQQGTSMNDALLIEGNVAYGKRPAGGGNIFYTDGGSRYIILKNNVSYDNPPGVMDFGPPSDKNDPLPYPPYSLLNNTPYGLDSGGCVAYGDIHFVGNYWLNLQFFNVCPYSEDGVSYPTNLTYIDNHVIQGAADVPGWILNAAGVQNFPLSILKAFEENQGH